MKALAFRLKESNKCLVDYTLHMGITWFDETIPEQMEWCVNEVGIKSFKAYLAYKGSIGIEYQELEQVMKKAASLNAIVLVHCEEGDVIIKIKRNLSVKEKQNLCIMPFHGRQKPNRNLSGK